jgi:hypothetical protein
VVFALVLIVAPVVARAQTKTAPVAKPAAVRSADSKARELTIEQQNAIGLLDGLSDQAKGIGDAAMRIRVEARLADALWERDRERAKRIYRRAFDEIDDLNESIVDPTAAPVGARAELYVELFSSLYRLDAEYANQLARGLDDDPDLYDGDGLPYENLSDRSATMLGVAASIAPRNPELAVELGRQCVQQGVPLEFANLLGALATSNRQLADSLAGDAVQVVAQSGASPLDMWGIVSYLFPELKATESVGDAGATATADLKRRCLEAAYNVTGRYVAALADRAIGAETDDPSDASSVYTGQGLAMSYGLARQLVPVFDVYDPERATAYRVLVAQIEGAAPADVRDRVAQPSVASSETVDSIESKAATATDPSLRASLYGRAASLALERDGYEAAKAIVAKIDDPDARARVLGPIARQAASDALQDRRYDDAARIAGDIPDLDDRAVTYCELARSLAGSGKRLTALEMLDNAARLLSKEGAVMTEVKARALVRVANAYAPIDAGRGFDVMRMAVDAVNKGLALADPTPQNRNPATLFRLGGYDPSPGLEELAQSDYFRALALAQSLDNRPLAILAQLAVVRGAMRQVPPAKPTAPPTPPAKKRPDQSAPGAQVHARAAGSASSQP